MYTVKLKLFRESLQIQYFESEENLRADTKGYEKYTLFEDIKRDKLEAFEEWHKRDSRVPFEPIEETFESSESLRISMSRTVRKIYDYGKSNSWDWFFTLTFNPEKVDSFDYKETSKRLSQWLNNLRKKCAGMKYLVVPEQHKSGRWHFHGLFSNVDSLEFVSSGEYTDKGQEIFNVGNYKLGFSTAIRCDGSVKVVSYVSKYITKELCLITKGKKRYWVSKNLELPQEIKYKTCDSLESILSEYDLEGAYLKSINGYRNMSICEIPIYSTNTLRFVENETNENNIGFDSGIDLEN